MKTKLLFLCLLLTGVLIISGCAWLSGNYGELPTDKNNESAAVEPSTPAPPPVSTTPPGPQPAPNTSDNSVEPGTFPSNLEYLTEEEKTEVLRIASEATGRTIDPKKVNFIWYGIVDGITMIADYDAVEKGIPNIANAQYMTFYPAINFKLDSGWGMTVAVNFKNGEVIKVNGPMPDLSSPDRFKR
ncbi:hypothetical protein ACFLXH_05150 [Chloroflexota bacterium]